MTTITLTQAMESAACAVYSDRQRSNEQFGPGLFDKAVEHHTRRGLRANVLAGTTHNVNGLHARFLVWTAEDGAKHSGEYAHFVYFTFFKGDIFNSVSRLSRGLDA